MDTWLYQPLPMFLNAKVGIRLLSVLGQNHDLWVSGEKETCMHLSVQGSHKIQST